MLLIEGREGRVRLRRQRQKVREMFFFFTMVPFVLTTISFFLQLIVGG